MKEALFYQKLPDDKVICLLCPHNCTIHEGKRGVCNMRKNIGGKLLSENYELVSALNFDPIEKKPLYHYYPGKIILSVGSIGCNFKCKFCQNWEIAQTTIDDYYSRRQYSHNEIVKLAVEKEDNVGIAYTYNEPIVWFEYMLDVAKKIKEAGLINVMVTNGFINREPLEELVKYVDAFSVDLKAYTETFYKEYCSSGLEAVKKTLSIIFENKRHLEITNLIIPSLNDDKNIFKEMIDWIADELDENVVLHLSRYYPQHKMTIEATPVSVLEELFKLAKERLNFVYLGNVAYSSKGSDTQCDNCGEVLIKRQGYFINTNGLTEEGNCGECGNKTLFITR